MSLIEELQQLQSSSVGSAQITSKCRVQRVLESSIDYNEETQRLFDSILWPENEILAVAATDIAKLLSKQSRHVSDSSVRRHRYKQCACFRQEDTISD